MTPTLEARLEELLPCSCKPWDGKHAERCLALLRPAILALLREVRREERERCAETVVGWVPSIDGSPASAIRALEDRND